jgi:hypothetical protein
MAHTSPVNRKSMQVIEKVVANIPESRMTPQVIDLVGSEADLFEELQRRFEPRSDQVVSVGRQMANEEFKSGARVEAGLQVACSHRQLIQIG